MRSVDLKILKKRLIEYLRRAAGGEIVLVIDRDQVVAEIEPPRGRSAFVGDAILAESVREGLIAPPTSPASGPPPRLPVMSFRQLTEDIESDREDR